MRTSLSIVSVVSALVVAGCPPSEKKAPPSANEACTRVGQNCEVSPGKLGTCVQKDGCVEASPACFSCQSQH